VIYKSYSTSLANATHLSKMSRPIRRPVNFSAAGSGRLSDAVASAIGQGRARSQTSSVRGFISGNLGKKMVLSVFIRYRYSVEL
jgi:hypothetical protein